MTAGIGTLEGGILAVLGTEIMVEGLTTDQIKPLAQIRRMEAMGPITAMVSAGAATMVMDSPTLAIAKQEPLAPRTTSRPHSLLPVSLAHRLALVTLLSPSPRHRPHSSILLRWCPTPCLLSSLSKRITYLKEVIYCFLSFLSSIDNPKFLYLLNRVTTLTSIRPKDLQCSSSCCTLFPII